MNIILVAAMAKNKVIGLNNKLPWKMPADLRHFKAVTLTKPVLMGRKTYESIGRPLPNRRNIVISRQPDLKLVGCEVAHSINMALELVFSEPEVCIIGGTSIYEQALPLATEMQLTYIDADITGDSYFPSWDENDWQLRASQHNIADSENAFDYDFVILDRRRKKS